MLAFTLVITLSKKDTNEVATTDTQTETETESPSLDLYEGWKTYDSERDGYSLKYPEDWIVVVETETDGPYFRNKDPVPDQDKPGYPEGYISVRVLKQEDDDDFLAQNKLATGYWYNDLGVKDLQYGPVTFKKGDVKTIGINGISAKSAKSVFTETNEVIFVLRDTTLYSVYLYPYGISTDSTMILLLDSLKFE